jgi:ATP-dependent DNA helicase RecG
MGNNTMIESETCEFKKSLSELKEGLVSIAAILNKHGEGDLWFGIRNDGKPVGLDINEKTLRDVSQAIAAHIEPKIYPKVTAESLCGVASIHIVFSGKEAPYFAYGRAYMRVADEDRQLSARELERLIVAKTQGQHAWDSAISDKKVTDLDENKLRSFVERARLTWDDPVNALKKLGLLKNGQVLNAATLFFDRKAPMQLRCAVFGTQESAMILDRHDFDGDILELIEEAQKYILKNIHIGMRLEGLYRVDVPEIPVEALREAIINAFCHRDYRDPDYVQVAVFKDRVEIRSPGRLYGLITIEDLRKGFVSQRRNPLIADLFRRIEMVEAWGRGMPLILKHAPDVIFREVGNLFIISFNRPSFVEGEATTQETPKQPPESSGKTRTKSSGKKFGKESSGKTRVEITGQTTQETPMKTPGKTLGKTPLKTPGKIIELLSTAPILSIPEIAQALAKSESAVERAIRKLRENNLLRRIGPDKGGHWEVLK